MANFDPFRGSGRTLPTSTPVAVPAKRVQLPPNGINNGQYPAQGIMRQHSQQIRMQQQQPSSGNRIQQVPPGFHNGFEPRQARGEIEVDWTSPEPIPSSYDANEMSSNQAIPGNRETLSMNQNLERVPFELSYQKQQHQQTASESERPPFQGMYAQRSTVDFDHQAQLQQLQSRLSEQDQLIDMLKLRLTEMSSKQEQQGRTDKGKKSQVSDFRFPQPHVATKASVGIAPQPAVAEQVAANGSSSSSSVARATSVCTEKWYLARAGGKLQTVFTLCETWTDFLGPTKLELNAVAETENVGPVSAATRQGFDVHVFVDSLSFVPSHIQARFYFKPTPPVSVPMLVAAHQDLIEGNDRERETGIVSNKSTASSDRVLQSILTENETESDDEPGRLQQTDSSKHSASAVTTRSNYDLQVSSASASGKDDLLRLNNPFWILVEIPLIRDSENLVQFNGLLYAPQNCIPQFTAVLRIFS